MVEFKTEIIEIAKNQFSKLDMEMSDVKAKLTTIYKQPFMAQFTDELEKQKAAVRILLAQVTVATLNDNRPSNATLVSLRIESKEEVIPFKGRNGDSYRSGLYVTALIDGNAKFAKMTLWGDANEMHPKLVVGKSYELLCVPSGSPLQIGVNDVCDINESTEIIPPISTVIVEDYPPIAVEEMEYNISADWSDDKLVRGTVLSTWMKVTKNDKNMGFLKIMGDDPEDITVVKFSRNAEQVIPYGTGSMVYALGQVTPATVGDDGLEKYPVGMWGNFIAPILVIPSEDAATPGIEASEKPILKPDGETSGFNESDVSGW